jgi:hypothetical protein
MTEHDDLLSYHHPRVSVYGGIRRLTEKKEGVAHDSPKDKGASKSK